MKKNIIRLILIFSLIVSAVFISNSLMDTFAAAINSSTIEVTYSVGNLNGDGSDASNRVYEETYDEDFNSLQLHEYNDDFKVWGKGKIVENGVSYDAAFAGWKLTHINDQEVTGNYFYPSYDYIYFIDEPFASFDDEISSLSFTALWGKHIYLRDKYNFKDLTKVFADTDTALFDLDTSVAYAESLSEDPTAGNSYDNPIDNLTEAIDLLGKNGGKIHVVNHYVFAADEIRYPYHSSFDISTSATTNFNIGTKITNGTLTFTGEGYGRVDGDSSEKANEKNTANYKNGYMYFKNTQGLGTKNGSAYKGLSFFVRFYCNTTFENINMTGYRENYYNGESRYTNNLVFDTSTNVRFVMKNTVKIYKRTTASPNEAITGVWAHNAVSKLKGLTAGGSGHFDIRVGTFGTLNDKSNIYLTVFGNMNEDNSIYSVYVKPSVTRYKIANVNNIHLNLNKAKTGTLYGISLNYTTGYNINVNNYNVKLYDCVIPQTSTTHNTYSANFNNVKYVIDGLNATSTSSKRLTNLFVGAFGNAAASHQLIAKIDKADVIVRGNPYISALYGGSNEISAKTYFNTLDFDIRSGTIIKLYGGGLGGPTSANKITLNISGGTIGDVFGGGAGGVSTVYSTNSPYDATSYKRDDEYKYFITSNTVYYVGKHYSIEKYSFNWEDGSSNEYDVIAFEYLYPKNAITALSAYYRTTNAVCVSEAMVEVSDCVEINISGNAKINNSVYGGGENGAVTGNIKINYESGTINGNIFGGGKGNALSYSASGVINNAVDVDFRFVSDDNALDKVSFITSLDNDYNGNKISNYSKGKDFAENLSSKYTTSYKMNATDFVNLGHASEYNTKKQPIVEVYSSNIVQLGLIKGDIEINVSTSGIKGNIYGGSDGVIASITGDSVINVNSANLSNNTIYGGGNIAFVGGNTTVNITSSTVKEVFAGGNEGDVKGNSEIKIDNSTVSTNIYGGGNFANTDGKIDVKVINNSNIENLFGGANQANVQKDININVSNSNISNFYGANNQTGLIYGNVISTLTDSKISNVYGGGNYADFKNLVSLTANNVTADYVYGGGNFAGVGSTNVVISGGKYKYIYGGGNEGKTDENVTLTISDATTTDIYGGANKADIGGDVVLTATNLDATNLYGANNISGNITNNVTSNLYDSEITNVYGGGNHADFNNIVNLIVNNVTSTSLYGGGNFADVGSINVTINNGQYTNVFGGGNEGNTDTNVNLTIKDAKVDVLFGGANMADIGGILTLDVTNVNAIDVFGANNISGEIKNDINTTLTDCIVSNNVYGGGNKADFTHLSKLILSNSKAKNVFGGGKEAAVKDTNVTIKGGEIGSSLFAGGDEGEVTNSSKLLIKEKSSLTNVYGGGKNAFVNSSEVIINSANISGNVYGGGYAGECNDTSVIIDDSLSLAEITIDGSVFGGGEGVTASVYNSTNVLINLNYAFTVQEEHITTSHETPSGASDVKISVDLAEFSYISGNVYGGGDLAQVGKGDIILSSNTATNIVAGTTNVTVNNGLIKGSVFGGGNGVPKNTLYNIYMGTVFGNTTVNIYGGHIESNVYGGGTQSRLYYGSNSRASTMAATVNIDENKENTYQKIVVGGSVFGGGDRGSGASHNASVPTTVGNVVVNIIGKDNSQIHFVHGGVYGDGNFCLVNGERSINISDFNTGDNDYLKTFYSLQRADYVNLNNSKIVLLGAVDLVEEGDNTIYSINRIEDLSMNQGSTIKLDQIVKYLEYMSSDVNTDCIYIDKGNNGENGFTDLGGNIPENMLTEEQIYTYQQSNNIDKNVVCVANGLFLEFKYESQSDAISYGYIQGLFTLQLLHANPGEGGGFVYADILKSKGTFICETIREEMFIEAQNVNATNYSMYYVIIDGNYVSATSYDESETYYKVNYMNIIDDVSAYVNGAPTKYCWYIDGSTINYTTSITGHIGSSQIVYSSNVNIPKHSENLYYALNVVKGNDLLNDIARSNTYNFKTSSDSLSGQDIAIEFTIGDLSLGFLSFEKVDDQIIWKINDLKGYNNHPNVLTNNFLTDDITVDSSNELFNIVLHKSIGVDTETIGMQLELEFVLYNHIEGDYLKYNGGTCNLNFAINLNIQRLVPTQSSFSAAGKYFSGVALNEVINITGNSSFTMQYQTRFIPNAFPRDGKDIFWALSTKAYSYYMDINGNYMTFEGDELISLSPGLVFDGNIQTGSFNQETIYIDEFGVYYYIDGNNMKIEFAKIYSSSSSYIPKNTKITMIDQSPLGQNYYYYICQNDETLIDVNNFMLMGSNISIKQSAIKPFFMNAYINGGAARITEEVIFIFDFSTVTFDSMESFSGEISFAHLYGSSIEDAIDIMDYVKIDIDNIGNKNYSRFYPVSTNFVLNPSSDGVDVFEVNSDSTAYEYDSIDFSVTIDHSDDIINSSTKNEEYSLKIEVLDPNSNDPMDLPHGIYVLYNGVKYFAVYDDKYIIIPIEKDGIHNFTLINELVSFKEITSDKLTIKTSIYLSGDSSYHNIYKNSVEREDIVVIDIYDKPDYSLDVTLDKVVASTNEVIILDVDTLVDGIEVNNNEKVSFKMYYKDGTNYREFSMLFFDLQYDENTNLYTMTLSERLSSGTYRLVISYGDKQVVRNFIVN